MRALLITLLLAASPAAFADTCPFPGQSPKLIVQLFFSQSVRGSGPDAGPISLRVWQRFLADTITPNLPDGFTVYDAYGQWLDPRTRVISRETTKVVVVAADDSPAFRTAIDAIATSYRKRFNQQSVGMLSNAGCGAF